ncbi:class I SAM-dependent methyltransferase [Bythopirellula polymerisocia]|uniref:Mg-protoporphyrin IX methyl transferase n=1 Tax=Bythopirellula polymerisocia TaxID=2528003 RepID=A0A5C6CRE5_9BACT|nr:methyltransferase domain-containing protein [Bythopirellula polymerisocia]TWU25676.1 Mg-protoporphyrin IX methyl transferase [Bythopirellula polymerisocia]
MSHQGWNQLAAQFEESVCDITASSGEQLEELVEAVHPTRRQTLVDAGCGIGSFAKRFGPQFGKVIAFDFASAMVRRARRRCRELTQATWQTLPLEDAGAKLGEVGHLVACLNVITSPRALMRTGQWNSLVQLVRPGGHLLVVVPSLESARHVAEQDAEAFGGTLEAENDLIRRCDTEQKHYTRQELRRALVSRGMRFFALRRIHYPWDDDGLDSTSAKTPWDWVCLAKKPLAA